VGSFGAGAAFVSCAQLMFDKAIKAPTAANPSHPLTRVALTPVLAIIASSLGLKTISLS
jgi:hypothetical protein